MKTTQVTISVDQQVLRRVDRLVKARVFPNRSNAFQTAVKEKMIRLDKSRLARECAKLDPAVEQSLADEGLANEVTEWPVY